MTIGNWINVGMLAVLIGTLVVAIRTFQLHTRSIDYSTYYDLVARFSRAWRHFLDAEESRKYYEFCELLNLIEGACHLHRYKIVGNASKEMLENYLEENIRAIVNYENFVQNLHRMKSGPETFCEMKHFAKRHDIDFPEL
ncbi:MAG: hypothetical protein OXG03_07500 [Gammaproteobacteria bacterium]|nr:hypothetical protein [Gammaproteobacteria bacterium]